MKNLTKENVTDKVLGTFPADTKPRDLEILTSLITHLHQFVRDVSLTTTFDNRPAAALLRRARYLRNQDHFVGDKDHLAG